jgi:hypothetical protein
MICNFAEKSRRMSWAVYMVLTGEKINAYTFWWGNLKEQDHLEDLSIDGRLKLILRKEGGMTWTGFI